MWIVKFLRDTALTITTGVRMWVDRLLMNFGISRVRRIFPRWDITVIFNTFRIRHRMRLFYQTVHFIVCLVMFQVTIPSKYLDECVKTIFPRKLLKMSKKMVMTLRKLQPTYLTFDAI